MNDREHARHCKEFNALIDQWRTDLFLGNWQIDTEHFRTGNGDVDQNTGQTPAAKCAADWRYMHAKVTCNCHMFEGMPKGKVEQVVIHELLHAVVHEMREWSTKDDSSVPHEERVVSHLTSVVEYLAKRGRHRRA